MALRDKHENASSAQDFVSGRYEGKTVSSYSNQPHFRKVVVLEVITDPNNIIDEKKIDYWNAVLKVSNLQYARTLPRNAIVGQFLDRQINPMFLFPFFPSHISLPCKPGETLWAMVEDPEAPATDIAYWFGRVTENHLADDVNHTHAPRAFDRSMAAGSLKDRQENDGKVDPVYDLRNGGVGTYDGLRVTNPKQVYLSSGNESIFEDLVSRTDGAAMMQYESVPRFRKRPGDLVLEGTNNTLVVLGTDRSGPVAEYVEDPDKKSKVPQPTLDMVGSAGSIDIVAGRGQLSDTHGLPVSTTSIYRKSNEKKGAEIHKELGKHLQDTSPMEGDPDFSSDRSRVLVSQRTMVDTNFGLSDNNVSSFSGQGAEVKDSTEGDAAVVIKSDKVRIIARSDIQIIVKGSDTAKAPDGKDILLEKTESKFYASITIKKNGDIVFTPSASGYIKLGSDNADKAILCTDSPAVKVPAANPGDASSVLGLPNAISDTSAGFIGTGAAGQGTWAKKVLVD